MWEYNNDFNLSIEPQKIFKFPIQFDLSLISILHDPYLLWFINCLILIFSWMIKLNYIFFNWFHMNITLFIILTINLGICHWCFIKIIRIIRLNTSTKVCIYWKHMPLKIDTYLIFFWHSPKNMRHVLYAHTDMTKLWIKWCHVEFESKLSF